MKMKPPSGSKKTNPNKANFFKSQNELKIACRKIRPHPGKPDHINLVDNRKSIRYKTSGQIINLFIGGTHYEAQSIFQGSPVLFADGSDHALSTGQGSVISIPRKGIIRRLAGQVRSRWKTEGIDSVVLQGQAGQPNRSVDQFHGI